PPSSLVVSKSGLLEMMEKAKVDHATAKELGGWYRIARRAQWHKFEDVRMAFPSTDQVGAILIFNIRHNRYRLIVRVQYEYLKLYIKALLTHKEYSREEWKKWA